MTKIYEALENASKTRAAEAGGSTATARPRKGGKASRAVQEKLLTLCQRVESQLKGREQGLVVEFVGAQPGEDSSKLVREFARTAAEQLHRSVLLLAATPRMASLSGLGQVPPQDWNSVIHQGAALEDIIAQVGDMPLAIGCIADSRDALPELLSSVQAKPILDELRTHFDLVIIDAPPLGASWDAVLLGPVVDGVVVVVEAGKTRWQSVNHGMEQFGEHRDKILGVVLNKQRHYIPGFIYRKML